MTYLYGDKAATFSAVLNKLPRKPVIYCAGKISYEDWRGVVLDKTLRPAGVSYGGEKYDDDGLFDPMLRLDCGSFYYGGPYFVSCDHGCAHGPGGHGTFGGCIAGEDWSNDHSRSRMRKRVYEVNCSRLLRADLVFAFVNEPDCFGTMLELGVAARSHKPIAIAFGTGLGDAVVDDMWMLQQPVVAIYRGRIADVWKAFRKDFLLEYSRAA